MKKCSFLPIENVDLKDGFWADRYRLNSEASLENVMLRFEESGRFDALRFNFYKTGKRPHVYFDSDAAKWIEAVAYMVQKNTPNMEKYVALCEELIDEMEAHQREDGYLNSTFQQLEPENIFKNRDCHELYCCGHLTEAAIAYHNATGKDRFLKMMERYLEYIRKVFIVEDTASFTTPGHQEIELALISLYRHTGKKVYLDMADHFLSKRGNNVKDFERYEGVTYTTQDNTDIYNLHEINGHCVRALYFGAAIADLAFEKEDEVLLANLKDYYEDLTNGKMYITGGVGSTNKGESFTVRYDLPNCTAYNESCASIAVMLFAQRMRKIDRDSTYGDVIEREMYNTLLSSTSLDGKEFFYENPMEIDLGAHGREKAVRESNREHLPKPHRVEVFDCSCCPPNVLRIMAEIGMFTTLVENEQVTIEQYMSSVSHTAYGDVTINENYALKGTAVISSDNYTAETITVRIPKWSGNIKATLNGENICVKVESGYATLAVKGKFELSLDFGIAPRFVRANPKVREDAGKVALMYGPMVYCLEAVDNGDKLWRYSVETENINKAVVENGAFHGMYDITMPAYNDKEQTELYIDDDRLEREETKVKFIPYFTICNRGECDMTIWVRRA